MLRTSDLTSWTCSSRPFICARALSSAGPGCAYMHSRALMTTKKCLRIRLVLSFPEVGLHLMKLRWHELEAPDRSRSPGAQCAHLAYVTGAAGLRRQCRRHAARPPSGSPAAGRTDRLLMVSVHNLPPPSP